MPSKGLWRRILSRPNLCRNRALDYAHATASIWPIESRPFFERLQCNPSPSRQPHLGHRSVRAQFLLLIINPFTTGVILSCTTWMSSSTNSDPTPVGSPEPAARASTPPKADVTPASRPVKTPAPSSAVKEDFIEAIKMMSLEPEDESAPEAAGAKAQVVDPWTVESEGAIDYDRLVEQFGSQRITDELLERMERVTGKPLHRFLRRGIFFSHRDLNAILDMYEKGQKFYLYTGRGPSSESLHLGHLIPFHFTKWLQDAFDCPLVIQLTDDEKFLFKQELKLEECHRLAYENVKDIIACGFDMKKTFIFSDLDYIQHMYPTILKIQKVTTYNQVRAIFGFTMSDNIGKSAFPAVQASPAFPSTFSIPFGGANLPCLIPCAIDQDAYFRMTRDVAPRLGFMKPSLLHCKFFPPLQGRGGKMSGSMANTAVYVTDTPKQIKDKINKHAFSGGQETLELQRELGANVDVDVCCEWLTFFMEDDERLALIRKDYASGAMLTGEVKKELIDILQGMVKEHQDKRVLVTPEVIQQYMSVRPLEY